MNFAIIVAAGKGRRMNKDVNKAFLPLLDKPMIYYSLKAFQDCSLINEMVIAAQKQDIGKISEIKQKYSFTKIKKIVKGGKERQHYVYNCLKTLKYAKKKAIA